jgi:hypothetical protein
MSDNGNKTGSEYEVGYGKPPLETRFSSENQPENAGRPKGSVSIKAELAKIMDIILKGEINPLSELPEDMPVGRKIALNLAMKAVADADLNAIKTALEHLDGKPQQNVDMTSKGEKTGSVVIVASQVDKDILEKI